MKQPANGWQRSASCSRRRTANLPTGGTWTTGTFEKDDGELVEADDYDRVCATLDMVAKGDLSKRKTADELDTSRPTIRRSLDDRPKLYGL